MKKEKFIQSDEFASEVQSLLMANEKTAGDIANDLVSWYKNLFELYNSLLIKANKPGSGFVLITNPDFTISYIEQKPLFDGSDETQEVFTVDTYQNYTLFETRQVPTSFLKVSPVSIDNDIVSTGVDTSDSLDMTEFINEISDHNSK